MFCRLKKKRKADDKGVSDTKAKMKKYDSPARMRTFQLSWIHGRPWLRHDKATSKAHKLTVELLENEEGDIFSDMEDDTSL